jgi:hypothetical protein
MFQMGLSLLANSRPSLKPQSFAGNLGMAGLQTIGMQQQQKMDDVKRKLLEAQAGFYGSGKNKKPQETFTPLTEEEEKQLGLDTSRAYQRSNLSNKVSPIGGAGQTFNLGTPAEAPTSIFAADPHVFKRYETMEEQAISDRVSRDASGKALQLLRGPTPPFTGLTSGLQEASARLFDAMSKEGTTDAEIIDLRNRLSASEGYDSQGGILVGQIIRLFGSGTGLSDADREYAAGIAGALRRKSPQGLEAILQSRFDSATAGVERYNNALKGTGFEDLNRVFNPMELTEYDFSSTGQVPEYVKPPGLSDAVWKDIMDNGTDEEKAAFRK